MKILYIDDDHLVLESVATSLRLRSHNVLTYAIPATLEWTLNLESFDPDIILCDYDMPGMNGAQVYERLPPRLRDRFVLFTGGWEPSPSGRCIRKPCDPREMVAALEGFRIADIIASNDHMRAARRVVESDALGWPMYFELQNGIGVLFATAVKLHGVFGPPYSIDLCFASVNGTEGERSDEIATYRKAPR